VPTEITIDVDKCKHDGLCAQLCGARVFDWSENEPPVVRRAELCMLCGQCLAICANDAIAHSRLDRKNFARIENRQPVEAAAMEQFLRQRRSVRNYKPTEVPRELLERIAQVAGFSPTSAHGKEGWVRSVTIVSGADDMRRVAELTAEYMRELGAFLSSFVVRQIARFKIEPRRGIGMLPDLNMRVAEYEAGRDCLVYSAPAAIFVHTPELTHEAQIDCDAALMAMMMAAHAHGLGTCWNSWIAKAADAFKVKRAVGLRRMLAIPEHHKVGAAMTIGFPAIKLHSVPQRETAIHWATTRA